MFQNYCNFKKIVLDSGFLKYDEKTVVDWNNNVLHVRSGLSKQDLTYYVVQSCVIEDLYEEYQGDHNSLAVFTNKIYNTKDYEGVSQTAACITLDLGFEKEHLTSFDKNLNCEVDNPLVNRIASKYTKIDDKYSSDSVKV